MKIKKYGKNKVALKKLLADEKTKVFRDGRDWTIAFKHLIGCEFLFEVCKHGLEITDYTGETFILTTDVNLEIA